MTDEKRSVATCNAKGPAAALRALASTTAVLLIVAFAASAAAGDFAPGTWTGKLERDKKKPQRARLILKADEEGAVGIDKLFVNKEGYDVDEFRLGKKKLWFTWEPGDDPVRCDLKWQKKEKHFTGPCKVKGGPKIATLTLTPPQEKDVAAKAEDEPAKDADEAPEDDE